MAATTQRRVTERENELTTELDDGTDGTRSFPAFSQPNTLHLHVQT